MNKKTSGKHDPHDTDKGAYALLAAMERLPRILRPHEAIRCYEGREGTLKHWTCDFPEGRAHNRAGRRHVGWHFRCLEATYGTRDGQAMVDLHLWFDDDGWTAWVWADDVEWTDGGTDGPKAS